MKYQLIMTYIKCTDMLDFFDHNVEQCTSFHGHNPRCKVSQEKVRSLYIQERNVRLILMVRYDGRHTFCKIKCPINPLPVTGEFEVPNLTVLRTFLSKNGWKQHESLNLTGLMD